MQNLMDRDQLADCHPISQVQNHNQLTESSPIFQVHEVSNTPHLQSQDLDINTDDADQSGLHPKTDPTPDAVMVTPEPNTRGKEEKTWDYCIDKAAVLDYPEEDHAKTEDGDDTSPNGSSDGGWLCFDRPLGFMVNFGYLCDSEGRMELSVDYVGPDPLSCQRHVPQEQPPDVEVDTWDESQGLPGDTLIRSPVFDHGGNECPGQPSPYCFQESARRAKGKVLRICNRKGGSRYVSGIKWSAIGPGKSSCRS